MTSLLLVPRAIAGPSRADSLLRCVSSALATSRRRLRPPRAESHQSSAWSGRTAVGHYSTRTGSSRTSHSVAQQPDPAAFEDVPAPPYLSPVLSPGQSTSFGHSPSATNAGSSSSGVTTAENSTLDLLGLAAARGDAKGKGKAKDSVGPTRKTNIKAQRSAITMTPSALDHLRNLLSSPTDPKLLRIGVKSRGCAGMAYHLDYVAPPGGRFDEVVEQDGVKVLIDSKALFSIIGSTMDWRDNRLSAGFVFDNPNVVDTCGCGESFNVR